MIYLALGLIIVLCLCLAATSVNVIRLQRRVHAQGDLLVELAGLLREHVGHH